MRSPTEFIHNRSTNAQPKEVLCDKIHKNPHTLKNPYPKYSTVPTPYRIHSTSRLKRGSPGITAPVACTIHGILKFDSAESPHLVYNELVSLKLAQSLKVPVADGVLTVSGDGLAYASLEVALPGISLPDALPSQFGAIARDYPHESAGLLAFDILIGNFDRGRNLKASLVTPHIPLFCAFDHSHVLLNIKGNPQDSIQSMKSDNLLILSHPFFKRISRKNLDIWIKRIARLDTDIIRDCCIYGKPFRAVSEDLQHDLFAALSHRARNLANIISAHQEVIFP